VNVELRDAPVRQLARALSQASGMSVTVDDAVPESTRLTVTARGVQLATVLEAVAQQAELMIAPEGEGVALQPWPALEVNGQRQVIRGSLAPWSDAWSSRPPNAALQTATVLGERARAAKSSYSRQASTLDLVKSGISAYPAAGRWAQALGSISVSGVGDRMIAVAQGGVGPQGEVGTWLILYRLDGSELRKVASTFVRPEGAPRATSPRSGAAP
jgi:hypothetical protein